MRKTFLTLTLAILMPLFSACSTTQTITIGYVGGLTGTGSELAQSGMYGALLAVDQINAEGGILGKKLVLSIKDDKNDPQRALEMDQEFLREGTSIIVGHMISGVAQQAISYINQQHALMISPTIAADQWTGIDDNFLRLIPSNQTQAQLIAQNVLEVGVKRVAIIHSMANTAFSSAIIDRITDELTRNGGEIIEIIGYDPGNVDHREIANQLKEVMTQGVVIVSSADECANFAQNFRLVDFYPTIFLPAWAMTNDLINLGGKAVEGVYGVNYTHDGEHEENYAAFVTMYIEKYGLQPTFASVLAYEAVWIVADAITSTLSADPMIVKKEILRKSAFSLINGTFTFDPFGDVIRPIYKLRVTDGKFESIQ